MATLETPSRPTRRARAGALAFDYTTLSGGLVVTWAVALIFLAGRTGIGSADVRASDAAIAAAWIGATVPAWTAWLAFRLRTHDTTPGGARSGLAVEWRLDTAAGEHAPAAWSQVLSRVALHPVGLPLWAWLALLGVLTDVRAVQIAAALPLLLALASAGCATVLWALWPDRRAPHDLVSRSRLVTR